MWLIYNISHTYHNYISNIFCILYKQIPILVKFIFGEEEKREDGEGEEKKE